MGEVSRKTRETEVVVRLGLDGTGQVEISTGIPFFDHMLTLLCRHGRIDAEIRAAGDIQVDFHHTVEDVGIAFGQALARALGEKRGIARYGEARLPMDEALAEVAVDLSGRSYLVIELNTAAERAGTFDRELVPQFFMAVASNAGMTLHVDVRRERTCTTSWRRSSRAAAWPSAAPSPARRESATSRPPRASSDPPMRSDIAIVDYGMGNLRSVQKALEAVGARADIVSDPSLLDAPGMLLPGVGAFRDAMDNLRRQGMVEPILRHIREGETLPGRLPGASPAVRRGRGVRPPPGAGGDPRPRGPVRAGQEDPPHGLEHRHRPQA